MTKLQKIWLWVGLGMFIIPEILWSPLVNLMQSLYNSQIDSPVFRENFLTTGKSTVSWLVVLLVQLLGALSIVYFTYINRNYRRWLLILSIIFSLISLAIFLAMYVIYSFRHGIGF